MFSMSRLVAYLRSRWGTTSPDPSAKTPQDDRKGRWFARVAVVFFVMAVPLFLITTNVRIVTNSGWLYSFGFANNDSVALSRIEKPELMRVARDIKQYFNSNQEPLQVRAPDSVQSDALFDYTSEGRLFSDREVAHMADVKALYRDVGFWQRVTFFYITGFIIIGALLWGRRALLERLARSIVWAGVVTILLGVAVGIGSLVGFDTLFEQYHVISFSNDLWQLDPNEYMLRIFPEGFFMDATLIVAGMTLAQAALGATVAGGYLLLRRRPAVDAKSAEPLNLKPVH